MLTKMNKDVIERDKLVIFSDDGTADIATIYDQDHEKVYAESRTQDYSAPIADLKSFVGSNGRIYTLWAESEYIRDTQRLAALEKSTVLRQVTMFEKPVAEKEGINWKAIGMYAVFGVMLLAVIFK